MDIRHYLVTATFILGTCGNLAALWILHKTSKHRNSKHVFMLRCLAVNDLVAQFGMLILTNLPNIPTYWKCALFVMLRAFGLGSGCVAMVMAIERWLALTKPFLYQQFVTKDFLRRVIFALWIFALILTHLPLIGFGLFYAKGKCCRYREATELSDVIYAYIFLLFGTCICGCILFCNSQVFCALSRVGKKQKKMLIRRISRATISHNGTNGNIATTPDELMFAKLMAFLCLVFLICWMPQMIAIPFGQFAVDTSFYKIFSRISDVLLCLYFTIDPYVYVLHQYMEKNKFRIRILPNTTPTQTPYITPTSELQSEPNFNEVPLQNIPPIVNRQT